MAHEYRNHMWYVDSQDKDLSYYKIGRISKRWWFPIFWNCVDLAICNAYCIHKQLMLKKKEKPLTKKDFRLKLASQLIGNYNSKKRGLASFASEKRLLVPTCHQRKCSLQGCKSRVKTCCATCKSHLCLKHNFIFHEGYEL